MVSPVLFITAASWPCLVFPACFDKVADWVLCPPKNVGVEKGRDETRLLISRTPSLCSSCDIFQPLRTLEAAIVDKSRRRLTVGLTQCCCDSCSYSPLTFLLGLHKSGLKYFSSIVSRPAHSCPHFMEIPPTNAAKHLLKAHWLNMMSNEKTACFRRGL